MLKRSRRVCSDAATTSRERTCSPRRRASTRSGLACCSRESSSPIRRRTTRLTDRCAWRFSKKRRGGCWTSNHRHAEDEASIVSSSEQITAHSTDDFFAAQLVDLFGRKPHFAQEFVSVLSEHWRRQARAALLPDKSHGMADAVEATGCRMVVLHDNLVRFGVRVFEKLSQRI